MRRLQKIYTQQDHTYLKPLLQGRFELLTSPNMLSSLRYELHHPRSFQNNLKKDYSGSRWGAYQGAYLKRKRQAKTRRTIIKLTDLMRNHYQLTKDGAAVRAYNLVISPSNATIKKVRSKNASGKIVENYQFVNDAGVNALDALKQLRTAVNKAIANHFRNDKLIINDRRFMNYGLECGTEWILTTDKADKSKVFMNAHLHGLLLVRGAADINKIVEKVAAVVNKFDAASYFNLTAVNTDYRSNDKPGDHAAIIEPIKSRVAQMDEIKAILTVANYNNKQTTFPAANQLLHDDTGNRTRLTQGKLIGLLDDLTKEKAIAAAANTAYNKRSHENYGLLKNTAKIATEIAILQATLLAKVITAKKHKSPVMRIVVMHTVKPLESQCTSFSCERTKPPP